MTNLELHECTICWSKEGGEEVTAGERTKLWLCWEEQRTLCPYCTALFQLSGITFPGRNGVLVALPSLPTCSQCAQCNPLTQWQHLAAPSKALSRWKSNEDPFLRLIAQELCTALLCNFLLQCVLKVKTLSSLLGDICHWPIKRTH